MTENRKVAFAIGAHPDDIEFMMGGTLFLLKEAGFESHYMTVANGSCGTTTHSAAVCAIFIPRRKNNRSVEI